MTKAPNAPIAYILGLLREKGGGRKKIMSKGFRIVGCVYRSVMM